MGDCADTKRMEPVVSFRMIIWTQAEQKLQTPSNTTSGCSGADRFVLHALLRPLGHDVPEAEAFHVL